MRGAGPVGGVVLGPGVDNWRMMRPSPSEIVGRYRPIDEPC